MYQNLQPFNYKRTYMLIELNYKELRKDATYARCSVLRYIYDNYVYTRMPYEHIKRKYTNARLRLIKIEDALNGNIIVRIKVKE